MEQKKYDAMVTEASPRSPLVKNCVKAFFFGGLICTLGEGIFVLLRMAVPDEKTAAAWVSILLIVLTGALTGIGVFDKFAKHAGAGAMVPITGFANAVVSPAVEFQTEGRVQGTAVKMFSIAGPVIVYGCSAATLYGLIYYFFCRG